MGYSIAIRCRSEKLKQKMLKFMDENYKGSDEMFGLSPSHVTDDLSYDHAKTGLGFEVPSSGTSRHYAFAVLKWMAIKIGRKRNFKKLGGSTYHYVYDGDDAMMIIVNSEWDKEIPKIVHGLFMISMDLEIQDTIT